MITEDYVSFEVAKILKEKGFDEQCTFMYDSQHKLYSVSEQCRQYYRNNSDWIHYVGKLNICPIAAPTLQMAMKWFRETHHIDICVCRELDEQGKCFNGYIAVVYKDGCYRVTIREVTEDLTYEEATNKAIEYGLTLIH